MNQATSMRQGATWVLVGSTGNQALNFAFGIVLARLLAPEAFGMLLTIQIFTGLAAFVSGGGMGQALVRSKDASREDYDVVFTLQLALGLAIYAFFFVAAPWFAAWYETPLFTDLMRVSALSFIFRPFNNIPANMLYRAMRYRSQALLGITTLAITNFTTIILAATGYGVWSLILGGITGALCTIPILMRLTQWRPRFSLNITRALELVRYGALVTLNDIVHYVRERVSTFILSHAIGPASVGLYNKGDSLAKMPHSFITGSVYHVLFRSMAAEQHDLEKCRYMLYRSVTLVAVYATPFYVGFAWLAVPFVRGVYGQAWVEAAFPLAILTAAWPFWLMENLSGAVLAAHNWLQKELYVQIMTLLLVVLGVWYGAGYGLAGVAVGVTIAAVLSSLAMHRLAIRCLHARWLDFGRALIPAVALNSALACTLWGLDQLIPQLPDLLYVCAMATGGALVYAACFLFLPIPALETERNRWKTKLGILHRGD